jgi:tRNA(adenine34) deaminase
VLCFAQADAGQGDPTAHAELLCIRTGAAKLGWQALREATLYVTLEPCAMCAGALLQSRVGTLVWGAPNPLVGADGSWVSLLGRETTEVRVRPHAFHPSPVVRRGVLASESAALLRAFFSSVRAETLREQSSTSNESRADCCC